MPAATSSVNGYLTSADWTTFNNKGNGTVTGVTATGPITSSGGTAPVISTSITTNKLIGRTAPGTGAMQEITIGTGLSLSSGSLNNTGLTAVPTIQETITAGRTLTNDILRIGFRSGEGVTNLSAIALGAESLANVDGGKNIGIGTRAGSNNTGGAVKTNSYNISIGYDAGINQDDGKVNNIAIGTEALAQNQSSNSIAIGLNAGRNDTGGPGRFGGNIFIGKEAGFDPSSPTVGNNAGGIIAIGSTACAKSTGEFSIAIGTGAGFENSGFSSILIGESAGQLSIGGSTIAIGNGAAEENQNDEVIAIGTDAGVLNEGANSIFIGAGTGNGNTGSNVIALGQNAGISNGESNSFIISNSCLPSFADDVAAQAHFAGLTTLSAGCTYLYHTVAKPYIGAYRTP
jgi:hypothetical protein